MPVIAAITIGQAPRDDTIAELATLVPGARWVQAGALDGLDDAAIDALAPRSSTFPLVTRLRSGRTVVVGEDAIQAPVQAAIQRIEREADVVVILCSGTFTVSSRVPLIRPGLLLDATVRALDLASLFVLTPLEGQVPAQEARWRAFAPDVWVRCATPFADTDFEALGREARARDASAVVLDCMGYTLAMKAAVARGSGLPTILVRSLAARVAAELLGIPGIDLLRTRN